MNQDRRAFLGLLSIPLLGLAPAPGRYDTLIAGGHVVDPAQGVSAIRDVAIAGGRIARVAADIPRTSAARVVDAAGRIVTPGLVDLHVHVFTGIAGVALDADTGSLRHGVTTVVDAGSAGATTFPGLRRDVIDRASTRVYAALNISTIGLVTLNELGDMSLADPTAAERTIAANRDRIVAIKVRLTGNLPPGRDLEALRRARAASDAAGVGLMVHIGGSPSPLKDILALLRRGDVVTHVLREEPNGVVDEAGRVRDEFLDARARGVVMDVGHGSGNFSWTTAEVAAAHDWWPDTISSDLHSRNADGPVFDLPTTVSKFLLLGLTLEKAIACATSAPAAIYAFPPGCGTLREGAEADVAVFRLDDSPFVFTDSRKETRRGPRGLVPEATFTRGVQV